MPLAAGFVGIIPALSLLTVEQDGSEPIELGWLKSFAWSCAVAFFGLVSFFNISWQELTMGSECF